HLGGDEQLQDVVGAVLTGGVTIEDEIDRVSEAFDEANVPLVEGSPAAGDDVIDAMLVAEDDVGVAFDDGEVAGLRDLVADDVKSIKSSIYFHTDFVTPAFCVKSRFGRIHIFGGIFIGQAWQNAATKGDGSALGVADGENHAALEAVVVVAGVLALA